MKKTKDSHIHFYLKVKWFLFLIVMILSISNQVFAKDCTIIEAVRSKPPLQNKIFSCLRPSGLMRLYKNIMDIFSFPKVSKAQGKVELDDIVVNNLNELDQHEKNIVSLLEPLRENFRNNSEILKKIDSFLGRVKNKEPYQQKSYELLKSLYDVLSYDSRPAEQKSIWSRFFKPKDHLVTALKPEIGSNSVGIARASADISNVINSFWIFITAKTPELFSCLSTQEKPIYESKLNNIYDGLEDYKENKFRDQILRDLQRDQDRILIKEGTNDWSTLRDLVDNESKNIKHLIKNGNTYEKQSVLDWFREEVRARYSSHPFHRESKGKSWSHGALRFSKSRRNSEKAAYYQIHSLYQGILADVTNNLSPMFIDGMGKELQIPPKYLHWSTMDPSTGQIHRYAIMNVFVDLEERVTMLPTLIEMPIDCTSLKRCQKSELIVRPLPFANPKTEKKVLGISQ